MPSSAWRSHFARSLAWSVEKKAGWVEIISSALGIAGPAVVASTTDHLPSGFAVGLGGLMIGGIAQGLSQRAELMNSAMSAAPAVAATAMAALLAGHGWPAEALMVLVAGLAALFGGYSRPAAVAAAYFVPYLVLTFSAAEKVSDKGFFALLAIGGMVLTIAIGLLVATLGRSMGYEPPRSDEPAVSTATAAQKWKRWRRLLTQVAGWQYTLRLVIGLTVATVIRSAWPGHHFLWITLAVALLTERQVEIVPLKTTQRVLGTAFGVALSGLFLFDWPPQALLLSLFVVLAALRPLARAGNYLVYSLVQTMIIVLILDHGQPPGSSLLTDRLIATLIGAVLVIGCNFLFRGHANLPQPASETKRRITQSG
jgi:hypothetical protein